MNDAERLRHDPAMRWIVGGKAAHASAASPSQMGRFETRWLTAEKNLSALADLSGKWIDSVHGRRPPRGIVLTGCFLRQVSAIEGLAIAALASGAQSLISTEPSKYSMSLICQRYGMPRWNHCRIVPGRAPSLSAAAPSSCRVI